MRKLTFVITVATALVLTASCTRDEGTEEPSSSPSTADPTTDTAVEIDFADLADKMMKLDDLCDTVVPASIITQFEATVTRTGSGDGVTEGPRRDCWSDFEFPDNGGGQLVYFIDPRQTNIAASEQYGDAVRSIIENGHGTEPDELIELDNGSPWVQGQVGAYETPTQRSAQRKEALAVVQGDFYVVSVLLSFKPDGAMRADCETTANDDCLMTADSMAEYMAEEYLPALYELIESKLDRK
ncbi:hypothetical protein L0U85_17285 [Glycomyces sp. L485]|uniref:hypothetical protein n=1 Tax=Glycomyces sp. L485 TaxID=2909235 RepID=UPI001F4B6C43|nr:hypothetical protein [Glycomyces sp. L485]MCH7232593.1 hypothetical protein [Glycomyces sp. L485]